jgi:undecaprenyl-phosphate galactose phosphotransferase/putative colanic acid biosynthesis UDP-glucose lipid carrier transferase
MVNVSVQESTAKAALAALEVAAPEFVSPSWGLRVLKRAFDVVAAAALLLVLLPFMAAIALWIKSDSRGPVLFRQRRGGRDGCAFSILKFRTMKVLEDGEVIAQAKSNDRRITRAGRFLRRTGFDELPQLVNVIRGEMSLVGPRPHALAHDRLYGAVIRDYRQRMRVKPGVTGWAQVHGFRGATPDIEDMRGRVAHDLWYVRNQSFALDLVILLRTACMAFGRRHAKR